jgi:arylsulfatase A-like enzyme/uncharacterized membrane protein YbhN (UPF0104 family)
LLGVRWSSAMLRRRLFSLVALTLLGAALWKMQPWKLDFSQVRLWPVVVALAINFGVYLPIRVIRWRTTLTEPPSFWRLYLAQIEGTAVGGAVGFGAQDVVRAARVRKDMTRFSDDFAATLVERLAEAQALMIMLAATAIAGMVPLWGLLPALLCGIGLMILPRVGARVAPRLHRWPKVAQGVLAVSRTLSFAVVARIVAFSWLGWGVEVIILLLAFAAFSLPVSVASAVLVVVGINVAITIPGPPAQVGTFEAGVAGALLMRGIAGPTALAFALSYHVLMAVPVYAAGALIVLFRTRTNSSPQPEGPPTRSWLVPAMLTAFLTTALYKLALLIASASGVEGSTSWLRTLGRLPLVLGWDVVAGGLVGGLAAVVAGALRRGGLARLGRGLALFVLALNGAYLAIAFRVATLVGAPPDKATLDLAFFSSESTKGSGLSTASMMSSIAPYLRLSFGLSVLISALGSIVLFRWIAKRSVPIRRTRWLSLGLALALVITSVVVVPAIQNTRAAIHTYGFERSPVLLLATSYTKPALRKLYRNTFGGAASKIDGNPFCFDLRAPIPARTPPVQLKSAPLSPEKTNLVVVMMESIAADDATAWAAEMPFSTGLGKSATGAVFAHHYSHWSQTMKAMFSFFCSELPDPDYPPITQVNPAIPCISLSEALKGAGYDTAFFTSADFSFDRKLRFYKHRKFDLMKDRHDIAHAADTWENSWGMDERVVVDAAASWIQGQQKATADKPFFLLYQMVTGHHPPSFPGFEMPSGATEEQLHSGRGKALRFVDDTIKRLHSHLAAQGLAERTLFVIVSDHGPGSGRPGMGEARDASVYERSVHVPLVVSGPQLASGPRIVTETTSHLDLAPTLLGLLDVAVPFTMKGRDLVTNDEPRFLVLATRPPLSQIGIRSGPYKLVLWQETGAVELFDIDADPSERFDIAAQFPEVVHKLTPLGLGWKDHSANLIENYAEILANWQRPSPGRRCLF